MKYAVIYEKTKTGYGAYVPDLPGCIAAAKTFRQTQKFIREAMEMHLKGMREDGEKVPEPQTLTDYVSVST